MILKAKTSYSINYENSFFLNYLVKYILDLNQKENIFIGKNNLFGSCIYISNVDKPVMGKKYIISKCSRDEDSFEIINVLECKWDLIFQLSKISNLDIQKYMKLHLKYEQDLNICLIKCLSINSLESFDTIEEILQNFEKPVARYNRFHSLVEFIKDLELEKFISLLDLYKSNFGFVLKDLIDLGEGLFPTNLNNLYKDLLAKKSFNKSLLQIITFAINSENLNDFAIKMIPILR